VVALYKRLSKHENELKERKLKINNCLSRSAFDKWKMTLNGKPEI